MHTPKSARFQYTALVLHLLFPRFVKRKRKKGTKSFGFFFCPLAGTGYGGYPTGHTARNRQRRLRDLAPSYQQGEKEIIISFFSTLIFANHLSVFISLFSGFA